MTDANLVDRLWGALLPMQRLAWEQGIASQAALGRVDADGVIQGVCGAPHFDREGVSVEAQAFAIMAIAASDCASGCPSA